MKAVIYARYSSKNQDRKSIKDQAVLCQIEAEKQKDEVIAVFFDEAKSGLSDDREGYQQMLEYVKKNKIRKIYTYHTSRISRDTAQIKMIVRELKYIYQTNIYFVSQGISTEQDNIELLLSANGIADEQYVESIRKNTWRGLYGRLKQGKAIFPARYGYKLKNGEILINEEEAKVVREIFNLYVNGKGFKEIAKVLNQRGIPSPRGAKWSLNAVREIIVNEIYKGIIVWNKRQYRKIAGFSKRKMIPNPPEKWIRIKRPDLKIISEEIWEEANRKRLERQKTNTKRKRKLGYTTLLGGFIKCGECGSNLIKQSSTSFKCKQAIVGACSITANFKENMLNKLVIYAIKQHLTENKQTFKEELEQLIKLSNSNKRTPTEIKKDIEALNNKLQSFIEIFEENPSNIIAKKIQEYEEKIQLLQMELKSTHNISYVEIEDTVIDLLIEQVENIMGMDISQAREIISQVLEEIVIKKDKVEGFYQLEYKFKNPFIAKNHQILLVAGEGFEPSTSGL